MWVEFKYENLAMFCYYCGRVGHNEKICEERKRDAIRGQLQEGQFGNWSKADARRLRPKQYSNGIEGRKDDRGVRIVTKLDDRAGEKKEAVGFESKREKAVSAKMNGTECKTYVGEKHERVFRRSGSMGVKLTEMRIVGEDRQGDMNLSHLRPILLSQATVGCRAGVSGIRGGHLINVLIEFPSYKGILR